MIIDQNFADSAKDINVKCLVEQYICIRKKIPDCNCNSSSKCKLRTCQQNGGVYTKLDREPLIDFMNLISLLKIDFDSLGLLIYSKISEKNLFIKNNPTHPDLQDYYDDIERLAIVLTELNHYTTQIRIDSI
ncbi:MAG: hypothetical protein M3R36_10685 [Bacteroidota bacterium]|nr:hypothetical protein [Bacteroidota bacterium]